jgi:hypothetical protein
MQKRRIDIMRRAFWILAITLLIPVFGSCIFAPKKAPPKDEGPPSAYKPLDKRDNLLFNLKLAYNQRNIEEYRKLLDYTPGVFIFYFGQDDINRGIAAVPQWGVEVEEATTEGLFQRSAPPGEPLADDVILELTYTEDEEDWFETVPETHPDETWYFKDATYRLSVRIGLTTHTQNKDVNARFTVREVEIEGEKVWKIVRWHDDI